MHTTESHRSVDPKILQRELMFIGTFFKDRHPEQVEPFIGRCRAGQDWSYEYHL